MILLSCALLSVASPTLPPTPVSALTLELKSAPTLEPVFHALFDPAIYFGSGIVFGTTSLLMGAGGGICQLTPWASTIGNECLLSSHLFGIASVRSFAQMFKRSPFFSHFFKSTPSSYSAWNHNQEMLSQVPVHSQEDKELLSFIQRRWLARVTGCYPFLADWMCSSFGISFQVHPESTNSYTRDPWNKFSDTYRNRVEAWKQVLPHPQHFPLILTRPTNIRNYLPPHCEVQGDEVMQNFVKRLACLPLPADSPVIVDVTSVLPGSESDPRQWLESWQIWENQFFACCSAHQLDLGRILCVQRVEQKEIGGLRLLPFASSPKENTEKQHRFLLDWVSRYGLTANRIELDRPLFSTEAVQGKEEEPSQLHIESGITPEKWVCILDEVEGKWKSNHPQKTFMFKGTLKVLKELCNALPKAKWEKISHSETRSSVAAVCFAKIEEQLQQFVQEGEEVSFHNAVSHIEQIHADLSSLLEIFAPFTTEDFLRTFREHLTCIPKSLEPLTGYGIHASAMTSLGGIFKAAEKTLGRPPRILYGENTYFECINAAERVSNASPCFGSTEQEWKEVDLVLAQFNPTVKRINFKVTEYQATEYHVEKIAETLHNILGVREGKPLSLALDCTLDFSDSQRVANLLAEFQNEIQRGDLNIMCYRSGLKFDIFGMDNYCGAPFFMIHNQDAKWACYDSLLRDPALETDLLSINWFCLAFRHATEYLESYRRQIFDNTRAVLNKIPEHLYNANNSRYRVIPVDPDANPTFVDIKIFGPMHTLRGEILVGVLLMIKCMDAGYPLLFRPGIGFYHPNLAVLFGQECTTVRLTVGLDPAQVDVIVQCMENIDACNGPYTNQEGV